MPRTSVKFDSPWKMMMGEEIGQEKFAQILGEWEGGRHLGG
jgi:hypothetical protein